VHVKGRIILYCQEGIDLRTVFGLSSYSFATESELDDDSLFVAADLLTQGWGADTKFRVTTKRIEKDTLETSQEINIKLGSHVVEKKGCKVSLKGFDKELTVEIMRGKPFCSIPRSDVSEGFLWGYRAVSLSGCRTRILLLQRYS
jgi:adenylyl- and sulfurtransferase ThiI